jgi:hypothetical protein
MSLFKHFGEQGDEHGGRLYWSEALGGLPYRGPFAPTLTRDELERDVEVTWDFRNELFDLSVPEQAEKYRYVMDRSANKWFYIHVVERHWIESEKKYIIYVEWSQRYGELSPTAKAATRSRTYGPPTPTPHVPPLRVSNGHPLAGQQKSDY